MVKEFKLYWRFAGIHLLSAVEYKGWWLKLLHVFFSMFGEPMVIILMFIRFGNIGDWTLERILLIYSIALISYSIAKCLCNGFDYFPWVMVRNGDFDRLLLRPKTTFVQVAASAFNVQRLAVPIPNIIIMMWAINRLGISLSVIDVAMLLLAIAGGMLIYAGVFVFGAGVSFFTIGGINWIYIFSNASYETTRIPVDHMPRVLRHIFTFLMPMLVVSYFPASAIGGWGEAYWRGWLALPAGTAFFGAAMLVWKIGVRHYKSTGS